MIFNFRNWVLQTFPFLEDDFDALTDYELFCKMMEYVKKFAKNEEEFREELDRYKNYFDSLDVQEEIDKKLDEMAQDGTLTNLIKDYINPIFEQYTNTIDGQINYLTERVNSYTQAPLIASSVSDMTDTNRIYVNTTDGYWYYYNGTEWTQGGLYQASQIITDKTLTESNVPADAKVVGDYLLYNFYNYHSRNLLDSSNLKVGFTDVDGTFYNYSQYNTLKEKINVKDFHGKTLYFSINEQPATMRVVTAYDSAGDVVTSAGVETVTSYLIPSTIDYVVITFSGETSTAQLEIDRITTYSTYFDKKLLDIPKNIKTNIFDSYTKDLDIASLNGNKNIDAIYSRKNFDIIFYGKVNGDFTGLRLGQGLNQYTGYNIHITPTGISWQNGTTDAPYLSHGLTIKDYIFVKIEVTDSARSRIIIYTNGGKYIREEDWYGDNKNIFVIPDTNTNITDAKLSYNAKDTKKFIWLFGDSYISWGDARIPYYLKEAGVLDNILLDGFSGAGSGDVRPDISELVNSGFVPKYIIWGLGMNNGDDGGINASWLANLSLLWNLCSINNIELILCTIPNTPDVNNSYKNNYVRNCGLRYIDLASAVNISQSDSTWYTGMLSSDNVHPTEAGAEALASKLINDFIEIIY